MREQTNQKRANSGRLCSVYCPSCRKVTDKISWNLLREAKAVSVTCPECGEITHLEYHGERGVSVFHIDTVMLDLARKMRGPEKADGGEPLSLEKIGELYTGTKNRIDEALEKAEKRLEKPWNGA